MRSFILPLATPERFVRREIIWSPLQPRSLAEKTGDAYQSFSGEPGVKGTPGF